MNKTEFFDYVSNPGLLNKETVSSLNEIIEEYPWFQTARMLLVKNLHLIDHVRFNSELKTTAAYIADRKRLFELIHNQQEEIEETEPAKPNNKDIVIKEDKHKETAHKQNEPNQSSTGLSTSFVSVSDYFQTDDVYETNDGNTIDFRSLSKKAKPEDNSPMVMPSADFLEYESTSYTSYQLNTPTDLNEEENRSFSGWLNALRNAPIEPTSKKEPPTKKKTQQLIDNFLSFDTPKIVANAKSNSSEKSLERHQRSIDESDDLLSETLANIYIKQKHYEKAIGIYEKLCLKYPEKNAYFAEQINNLEKRINNQ